MRQHFFSILLFAIAFFIGGCVTHKPIIFDETLSDTEITTIYWCGTENCVHPISYNGIKVDWKIGSMGYYPIKIPAGKTTFELEGFTESRSINAISGSSSTTTWDYTGKNISYNFAKGETYTVYFIKGSLTIHSGKSISSETILEKIEIDWKYR